MRFIFRHNLFITNSIGRKTTIHREAFHFKAFIQPLKYLSVKSFATQCKLYIILCDHLKRIELALKISKALSSWGLYCIILVNT